ncbi:hypothetical protein Q0Z83_060240 [Actinoplanes sichuanensis]|uniref:Uncharacterized protein n=1 Tax=Actinoplanes sichuanensis TaxID=512349 RepID=A0ABW4A7Q2_9ACTN|nr:hypothetical protein [Actinoplanes sichuanensis]BEL07833.1 hypothetical protein Q0Z83_060240 [Actinoplanes sichuanensis]
MADLFELTDLASYLQRADLDVETAVRARRIASGKLRSATRLAAWPDPVPDDLWTWAVELAGLAYNNPELLATETTGAVSSTWERGRQAEILAAARETYGGPGGIPAGGPLFSFPEPDWRWSSTNPNTCV